ncbi:MAG TPA: hypothetical protein DD670_04720 [Planctomycetaceae bacterium]|nr:hypothetical protein [Planctomycetaceae bacterium]
MIQVIFSGGVCQYCLYAWPRSFLRQSFSFGFPRKEPKGGIDMPADSRIISRLNRAAVFSAPYRAFGIVTEYLPFASKIA